MNVFMNASWPQGKWEIKYDKDKDRYIIKTEYGTYIGSISPTLVAYWIVRMNNLMYEER